MFTNGFSYSYSNFAYPAILSYSLSPMFMPIYCYLPCPHF